MYDSSRQHVTHSIIPKREMASTNAYNLTLCQAIITPNPKLEVELLNGNCSDGFELGFGNQRKDMLS